MGLGLFLRWGHVAGPTAAFNHHLVDVLLDGCCRNERANRQDQKVSELPAIIAPSLGHRPEKFPHLISPNGPAIEVMNSVKRRRFLVPTGRARGKGDVGRVSPWDSQTMSYCGV